MVYEITKNLHKNTIMKTIKTAPSKNKVRLFTVFLTLLLCTCLNKIQVMGSVLFLT